MAGCMAEHGTERGTGGTRYTRTAMALHWAVAALVIGNLALAWSIGWFPDIAVRPAIDTHKSIGITVLGLVLMRVLWRLGHPPPPLPADHPRWERGMAHAAHAGLYALILAMPVSGWIHDSAFKDAARFPLRLFGLVPWPRIGAIMRMDPAAKEALHARWFAIHVWLSYALLALLALHLLGVLKHELLDGKPVLGRMLPRLLPGRR
ncbi:MAG: cytochrome b [Gluconacetobacter diazotrophicus]|nr:cytochrome b [Gluconacetobacter diazotrophicus]